MNPLQQQLDGALPVCASLAIAGLKSRVVELLILASAGMRRHGARSAGLSVAVIVGEPRSLHDGVHGATTGAAKRRPSVGGVICSRGKPAVGAADLDMR